MDIRITSYAAPHRHTAERAHITLNLRAHFTKPHTDARLSPATARDRKTIRAVRRTPGIRQLLAATVDQAQAYAHSPAADQPLHIALGCAGGQDRAAAVAHLLTRRLRRRGHTVTTDDRDAPQDVIDSQQA